MRVRAKISTQLRTDHWVAMRANSAAIEQTQSPGCSCCSCISLYLWWNERDLCDVSLGRNGRVGSGRVPFATNVLPVRL